MAVENGSAFLLKISDGAVPVPAYVTVAGLRTTQMAINGEAVNVTTKDSGGQRRAGLGWTNWPDCCGTVSMRGQRR